MELRLDQPVHAKRSYCWAVRNFAKGIALGGLGPTPYLKGVLRFDLARCLAKRGELQSAARVLRPLHSGAHRAEFVKELEDFSVRYPEVPFGSKRRG